MIEETIIGPQRCPYCGGEYGEHDKDCRRPRREAYRDAIPPELLAALKEYIDATHFSSVRRENGAWQSFLEANKVRVA